MSKSQEQALDSSCAHPLDTLGPTRRCSGPLRVLVAGGLLPVTTVLPKSHAHREGRLFPQKNSGCSKEGLMDAGWPKHTFPGTGKRKRNHGEIFTGLSVIPRMWSLPATQDPTAFLSLGSKLRRAMFANAFVLWICGNWIYGPKPNLIDMIRLAFSLKEFDIVVCVGGLFINIIWIFSI